MGRKFVIPAVTFTGPTLVEPDSQAPTAPTGLSASTATAGRVTLAWSAASDNIAVTGYRVYRDGALLASPTGTTYADTTGTVGTAYSYQVAAVDAAGNESAKSGAVGATPRALNDTDLLVNGSLVLVEPASTTNAWAAGVPANGAIVPNLASSFATATVGAAPNLAFANNVAAGAGVVERSGKGGLHVTPSRTVDVSGQTAGVNIGTALRTYIEANLAHDWYVSWWGKVTRAGDTSVANTYFGAALRQSDLTNTLVGVGQYAPSGVLAGQPGSSDPRRLGFHGVTGSYISIAADGSPAGLAAVSPNLFAGGVVSSDWLHKAPSFLMWRIYVEDLTLSGRTHAQVDAIDYALYQAAVGTGGRYAGDTYTDPATVA